MPAPDSQAAPPNRLSSATTNGSSQAPRTWVSDRGSGAQKLHLPWFRRKKCTPGAADT